MLPNSMTHPPLSVPDNIPSKSKPKIPLEFGRNNCFFFLTSLRLPHFSFPNHIHHPRTWLVLSVLLLQLVLLSCTLSLFFPLHRPGINPSITTPTALSGGRDNSSAPPPEVICPHGKIYVYQLPPIFNSDLIKNCHQVNPWHSRCDALSNGGFGMAANGISNLVPGDLRRAWHWTDQFSLELIYHNRMMRYRCRSFEPESAAAFYVPSYEGLAVEKYLWVNNTEENRDHHCKMMLDWLGRQPYWKKSGGWDHFLTIGRITWDFRRKEGYPWGSSCIFMPNMHNVTRLLIEREPSDDLDVGVPYPTGFHPSSPAEVAAWQDFVRSRSRGTLYCFAGGSRSRFQDDFRGLLRSQCDDDPHACRAMDCVGDKCGNRTSAILETFLDSEFCLQPRGDSFTRRSTFDCMVAGSIPVFFWRRTAYLQYAWFLPDEPESYSVFIHRREVRNGTTSIRSVLEKISREKRNMMREKVIEYIPRLIYAKPEEGLEGVKDAFDVAVEGILKRFKQQRGR